MAWGDKRKRKKELKRLGADREVGFASRPATADDEGLERVDENEPQQPTGRLGSRIRKGTRKRNDS
jgi:hypothetical protein